VDLPLAGLSLFMLMKHLRWQILVVVVTLVLVGILLLSQQPIATVILPQAAPGGVYTEGLVGAIECFRTASNRCPASIQETGSRPPSGPSSTPNRLIRRKPLTNSRRTRP